MGQVSIIGVTYEVYGDAAGANDYFNARVGSGAWSGAVLDEQLRALVSATRRLDRLSWQGQKTSDAQPLEFPRTGLTDRNGNPVDSGTVPVQVEEAGYELALAILTDASAQSQAGTGSNVKRAKAGSAEVEFFRPVEGTRLVQPAQELVGIWLGGTSGLFGKASGTDGSSSFCDPGYPGLNEGYP